jgi:Transposase DDE domain group 1
LGAIFGLPQCGRRSGGLTGDRSGAGGGRAESSGVVCVAVVCVSVVIPFIAQASGKAQPPAARPVQEFHHQADSWTTARRVVTKVEHHASELFPRLGFIVTNLLLPNRAVVRFYNKRGTAEQWIKEGKQAAHWT